MLGDQGTILDPPIVTRGKLPPVSQASSGRQLAVFGEVVVLEAAETPAVAQAGSELELRLAWRVLRPPSCECQLFVHLIGAESDQPVAQVDEPILLGRYPMRWWEPEEFLSDGHRLPLPTSLNPGEYSLRLGLYDPQSLERLAVTTPTAMESLDYFFLGTVAVQ
jgi:hypothetical protein